jgi:hypothetical protein
MKENLPKIIDWTSQSLDDLGAETMPTLARRMATEIERQIQSIPILTLSDRLPNIYELLIQLDGTTHIAFCSKSTSSKTMIITILRVLPAEPAPSSLF